MKPRSTRVSRTLINSLTLVAPLSPSIVGSSGRNNQPNCWIEPSNAKMPLRSRKKENDSARKEDPEGSFKDRIDAPLRRLQAESEAFNYMFVDFAFKLSGLLVAYSVYYAYEHLHAEEIVAFHTLSAICFIACFFWLRRLRSEGLTRIFYYRSARLASIISLGQVVLFAHMIVYESSAFALNCVPVSALYIALVGASLLFMRSNSTRLGNERENLFKSD